MRAYRCYMLDANFHIMKSHILECDTDADAELQGREILAATRQYQGVEVWYREKRVCLFSGDKRIHKRLTRYPSMRK